MCTVYEPDETSALETAEPQIAKQKGHKKTWHDGPNTCCGFKHENKYISSSNYHIFQLGYASLLCWASKAWLALPCSTCRKDNRGLCGPLEMDYQRMGTGGAQIEAQIEALIVDWLTVEWLLDRDLQGLWAVCNSG
jgi:hypothetical protein